jgi:hypothetical protein
MSQQAKASKLNARITALISEHGSKVFINKDGEMTCGFVEFIREEANKKIIKAEQEIEKKICNVCEEEKELDEFHVQRYCKSRVANTCKICRNTQRREDHERKMKAAGKKFKKRKPKYQKS